MPIDHVSIFTGEIEAFGGAERSILALCRFLHGHGVPHAVVTYRDAIGLASYAGHSLEVVALEPLGGVRSKVAALRSHAQQSRGKWLASGYQAALHLTLARQRGFDTLMHDTASLFSDANSRGWKGRLRTSISNRVLRSGLNSGGITIVTSEFLQAECWRDFHIRAAIARMGGAAVAPFRERPVDQTLNLLSVCRVEANKRLDWIVSALQQLEAATPPLSARVDWHLRIAGKGSQIADVRQQIAQAGLQERIAVLGFVPDAELAARFEEAHLFVMPAVQGYGIPAVEALGAGIPVLLHRDSGVSDVLLDTPWATVATGGPAQMRAALAEAMEKAVEGAQLGKPLPRIETEASWSERVAELCGWMR